VALVCVCCSVFGPKAHHSLSLLSVFSAQVNVVAAYIGVVLYKLGNLGLVVSYRRRRSWRQASKDATAQLFDTSSMLSSHEFEMEGAAAGGGGGLGLELMSAAGGGGDGLAAGLQHNVTTTLPTPSPRGRRGVAPRSPSSRAIEQRRSANLDKQLGLSVEPQ